MVGSKQSASYLSGCLWTTVTWPAVSQSASAPLRCVATGDDFYDNCGGIVTTTTTTATTTLRQRRRERKQQQQQQLSSQQQQQQQLILLHRGELKADSTMALAASFNVSYYFKETSQLFKLTIYCYFLIMLSIGKNRLNQRMTSRGLGHAHGWVFSGPGSTWPVQTP